MKRWKIYMLCAWLLAVAVMVMLAGCMDSQEILMAQQRLAEVENMAAKCGTVSPEICCEGLAKAVDAIEKDIQAAED